MNYYKFLLSVIFYFAMSIGFPWEILDQGQGISYSYLFDILFVILNILVFKIKFPKHLDKFSIFSVRVIMTFFLGLLSILIIEKMSIDVPFKLISHIEIKLLILAPILEELVFRFVFLKLGDKAGFGSGFNNILNAFLFSLSHLPAYWLVPVNFRTFILVQMAYTFILGLLCAGAVKENRLIVYPIILHFLFNFMFYFAIIKIFP